MSDRKFSVVVQLFRRLWQGVTQHLLGNGPPPLLLPDFLPTLDFPFPPSVLCSARTHKSPHSPSFLCTQCKRRKPKTDLWMLKIEGGKRGEWSVGLAPATLSFFLLLHNPRIAGKLHKIIKPSLSPLDISLSSPRNLEIQTSLFRTPMKWRGELLCALFRERWEKEL